MSKKTLTTVCAVATTILFAAGLVLVFVFAWKVGVTAIIQCLVGFVLAFLLAPVLHELGHIILANAMQMQVVYAKFFCVKLVREKGKIKCRFASPFAADETQAVPKKGGDMQKRAIRYTLGGLIFEGAFTLAILAAAITLTILLAPSFLLWGMLPYAAYLFLLNALPLEYASGKTDMLIYIGLKKGAPAEKTMLSAMEIQGELFEGKSFAKIDEGLYFDLPQLAEDEPLFAVMLDLRYRYYLDKGDIEKAGACLNRLVAIQEYLPETELQKLAAECVYLYSLLGDYQNAEESGKIAKPYLEGESATAKRILLAFTAAFGDKDKAKILLLQAQDALQKEEIKGVEKFEKGLISRVHIE